MAYQLLKGMLGFNGLELRVILLNEGKLAKEINRLGIHILILREDDHHFLKIAKKVRKFLREYSPHIIHSHRYKENLLAYVASRGNGTAKLVSTQHGAPEIMGWSEGARQNLVTKLNFWGLCKKFQRVVAVSEDIRRALLYRFRFPEEKVIVIYNAISVSDLDMNQKECGHFVVGSAGRFFPVKDYPFMVEICKRVSERNSRIRFELAGDGPELDAIIQRVEEHGLQSKFTIRGFQEEMNSFYRSLDLYLNTSLHEGIPMSVLEAMAHGVPIVAPKVGGLSEMIENGVQGFLLETRDAGEFAERCLRIYADEHLRRQMGKAAREKVEKDFSVERMASQYFRLYQDVLGE